jgi:hypothetical protein
MKRQSDLVQGAANAFAEREVMDAVVCSLDAPFAPAGVCFWEGEEGERWFRRWMRPLHAVVCVGCGGACVHGIALCTCRCVFERRWRCRGDV